ncbi:hypothetical protein FQZ97_640640 [compost metagenome]
MPSFHSTVRAISMPGACTLMPSADLPANSRALRYSSAAWISALDGMQPMFRQVPPRAAPSTSTVRMPSCPARMAAT